MLRRTRRSFAIALAAALVTSAVGRAYAPCDTPRGAAQGHGHGTHEQCAQPNHSAPAPEGMANVHHHAGADAANAGHGGHGDTSAPNAQCQLGLHCAALVMVPTLAVVTMPGADATTAPRLPSRAPHDPVYQPESPPPKG